MGFIKYDLVNIIKILVAVLSANYLYRFFALTNHFLTTTIKHYLSRCFLGQEIYRKPRWPTPTKPRLLHIQVMKIAPPPVYPGNYHSPASMCI